MDVVERNLTSFRITVEELKTCAAALLNDLETEDDLNIANDWYAKQSEKINDFIEKTVRWISSAKWRSKRVWKLDHKLEQGILQHRVLRKRLRNPLADQSLQAEQKRRPKPPN